MRLPLWFATTIVLTLAFGCDRLSQQEISDVGKLTGGGNAIAGQS
jgi:hypothetical protein